MQRIYYNTGVQKLRNPFYLSLLLFGAVIVSFAIAKFSFGILFFFLFIPVFAYFLERLFDKPKLGLYAALIWGFLGIGLKRYMIAYVSTGAKLGLAIDFLLLLTMLAFLFKDFKQTDWSLMKNKMTGLVFIWFLYNVLQIINPEARSLAAWFYAVRGVALYMLFAVPLTMVLLNDKK